MTEQVDNNELVLVTYKRDPTMLWYLVEATGEEAEMHYDDV